MLEKKFIDRIKFNRQMSPLFIMAAVLVVVIIKFALAGIPGYPADVGMSKAWCIDLARNGFSGFYSRSHVVYAPGYMYLLWISGKIALMFSVGDKALEFLVKFWAIMSDFIGAYLIYLIGKKYGKQRLGLLLGFIYAVNPGVFFNSSVWGQFDSIPATLLFGAVYCFNSRKNILAVVIFALAVLVKPQSGLLLPLILIVFFRSFAWAELINSLRQKDKIQVFNFLKVFFRKVGLTFLGGVAAYILVVTPFYPQEPSSSKNPVIMLFNMFYWLFEHYSKSLKDYPYATANAFNIWTILGGQPVMDNEPFGGLTFAGWGFIMLAPVILLAVVFLLKKKNSVLALYFTAYFLLFGSFMFTTRMHERYLFPALIFLTVCILWDSKFWVPMILLSLCVMGNHWYIYYQASHGQPWITNYDTVAMLVAIITLAVMIYTIIYVIMSIPGRKNQISLNRETVRRKR